MTSPGKSGVQDLGHLCIPASAGSGKTFRLSGRVIALLARDEAPESILATTFTRKAAGEILERVLVRLARGACDEEVALQLGEDGRLPEDSFATQLL